MLKLQNRILRTIPKFFYRTKYNNGAYDFRENYEDGKKAVKNQERLKNTGSTSSLTNSNQNLSTMLNRNLINEKKKFENKNENKILQNKKTLESSISSIESQSLREFLNKTLSEENSAKTFEDLIRTRLQQASRSILFRLDDRFDKNIISNKLIEDLLKLGLGINSANLIGKLNSYYLLVEFKSNNSVEDFLESHVKFRLNKIDNFVPSTLRLLSYTTEIKNIDFDRNIKNKFVIDSTNDIINASSILKKVSNLNGLSSQIQLYYDLSRINDTSQRIRYFIASLIESGFNQLFKNCICLPFGSSVNNFGSLTSDLDLSFSLNGLQNINLSKKYLMNDKIGSFFFMNKNQKLFGKNLFGIFERYFDFIYPKFRIIEIIPFAKVPIIKFEFDYGEQIKCDLSISNYKSAYLMSKLFWSLSRIDPKVAPLVFIIRQWALVNGIRNTRVPNDSLSNFHITSLVLYYLKTILFSSIDNLIQFDTKDISQTDFTNETHLANTLILDDYENLRIHNNKSLGELLKGFFKFYKDFDFKSETITFFNSPYSDIKEKNLFIENPFFPNINAAMNVSNNKVNHFRESCKIATEILRHEEDLVKFLDLCVLKKIL